MPVFEYVGVDKSRKKASGVIEAESDKAARLKLRKMGIYPEKLVMEGAGKKVSLSSSVDFSAWTHRIKIQDVSAMTRQLSTLISAGIPLVESLSALVDQVENPKLRKIVSQVREKVTEGQKLSDAMRAHPKVFSDLFVNMINAGENSGALDQVLNRLATFTENQTRLQSKVKGAMMYPIIVSVVGLGLVVMLMVFVIPKLLSIFEDQEIALPLPTRALIAVSHAMSSPWFFVILFVVVPLLIYGGRRWLATEKGRLFWDRRMLKLPLFGKLTRLVAISRFARTLSTLLNSGVPLLSAMGIVRNIVSNVVIRRVIEDTATSVQEGASVAEPLRKSGEFPTIVTQMIAIGEKTGELEKMLECVANTYDEEVENTVSGLTTAMEPLMIVAMAGVIFFIVLAVFMPMMKMSEIGG